MTVQELIENLEKVENKNLEVMIKGSDSTDWVYHNKVKKVKVGTFVDEDEDECEGKRIKAFIIDGGMF